MVIPFFLLHWYSFLTGHSEKRCSWCWLKCVFHLEKVAVVLCTMYTMHRFYSEACTFTEFREEMPLCLLSINSWKDMELMAHDLHSVIINFQNSGEDFYLQFLKMLGHRLYYLWLLRKVWHEEALRNTFEENLKYCLSKYNRKKTIIIFFWIVLFIFLSFFFLPLFCFFVFSINCKWHIKYLYFC